MLAVIKGQESDRIPFCPRLDLWYIANKARGTLPKRFHDMTLVEIANELDVGVHATGTDRIFTDWRENKLAPFGIHNNPDYLYRIEVEDFPVEFHMEGGNLITRIITDTGVISTQLRYTAEMQNKGISGPFVDSYPINSTKDLESVGQFFEHLKVVPTPNQHSELQNRVGDQGIAVAIGNTNASPIHLMLSNLMSTEQFFYLYMDNRKSLYQLVEQIEPIFEKTLETAINSSAEIILWGGNFDEKITYPPFFEQEILPWLKKACKRIHEAGKLALCHLDGENNGLFPLYRIIDFDIAESVCTFPMVKNTLKDIRQELGNEKTVWGGIPSVALLPNSMSDSVFDNFLNDTFDQLNSGNHLILGVSDMVPPDADLNRLEKIKQKIEHFGKVKACS